MTTPPILLYTTPTCPDCQALKVWLNQHGIAYTERDLTDPAVADQAKARYGVRVAPITVVGNQFFFGTFADQRPELQRLLG
ncbi:NrdH-redoxin (plasmid) [Deinococcus aetherius]|uniref:NrdH-redoxin n=1 Tax=Deinococcus aetherius TaxID=200252 RepID=A0ABM8ALK2_9DEIO|nr:glutaredoxin family protein [Deinococcus aetherius]BDP44714.1 NrdH-redoxin [Deinococcus aetherius]